MNNVLHLLVVEDHDDLREATVSALTAFGYVVCGVACAEEIDEVLGRFRPDAILLDLNLPGEDGLSIAQRLRAAQPDIGIIMVTARNRAQDVMSGYRSGADIYVAKPASPEELHAAIQALARRLRPPPMTALQLDTSSLRLRGSAGAIDISHADCQLLAALARAREHRLETWQLLELLGKQPDELEKKALAVHIVRLRKKLEEAGAPDPTIKAIRGTGYQLCIALELR